MAKRKRNSFARIGVLSLVLLAALGLMGVGYAAWSDTLNISGTLNTGTINTVLSCGAHSPNVSCSPSGMTLIIQVTNAEAGVGYYCDFSIQNTGTIPVKVKSIIVSPLPPASGVNVEIQGVAAGNVIDPGVTRNGTVHVYDTIGGQTFTFTVTFSVVQWNQ